MNRRSLSCNWTEEDQRTSAQWLRGMAVFYTCIALLVLGLIALTKPSSVAPNEPGDRQTSSVGLQGERIDRNADVSFAKAQSDALSEVYPGRFVANCKPAGNGGCACDTDRQKRVSTSADFVSEDEGFVTDIRDPEHLRLIEWVRQTCTWLMQSEKRR